LLYKNHFFINEDELLLKPVIILALNQINGKRSDNKKCFITICEVIFLIFFEQKNYKKNSMIQIIIVGLMSYPDLGFNPIAASPLIKR